MAYAYHWRYSAENEAWSWLYKPLLQYTDGAIGYPAPFKMHWFEVVFQTKFTPTFQPHCVPRVGPGRVTPGKLGFVYQANGSENFEASSAMSAPGVAVLIVHEDHAPEVGFWLVVLPKNVEVFGAVVDAAAGSVGAAIDGAVEVTNFAVVGGFVVLAVEDILYAVDVFVVVNAFVVKLEVDVETVPEPAVEAAVVVTGIEVTTPVPICVHWGLGQSTRALHQAS